jgi:putative transposase
LLKQQAVQYLERTRPQPQLFYSYVEASNTRSLHDHQALRAQSRRGDCSDNAQAESLWSRLKTEVLEARKRPVCADLAAAQRSVADYFGYYNHERLHARTDYHTPSHTHQQLLQLSARNCPA